MWTHLRRWRILHKLCLLLVAVTQLICFVTRLEAATSRLEDIASSTQDPDIATNGASSIIPAAVLGVPDQATTQSPPTPIQLPEALPLSIEGFDTLINGDVTHFVNMSEGLGGLIAEQVQNGQ